MKKLEKFINKNYININIILLLLAIYVILFPIISIPIKTIFPVFGECTYLRITGKPCPLCGGTRYIFNIFNVFKDITYLINPFGIMVIVIVAEVIFRIYNLWKMKIKKVNITNKKVKIDMIIHSIIFIFFMLYEIIYLLKFPTKFF